LFGFGLLGICLFWLVLSPLIACILIASTKRFVRHLSQPSSHAPSAARMTETTTTKKPDGLPARAVR
jgi:hypothetical protein